MHNSIRGTLSQAHFSSFSLSIDYYQNLTDQMESVIHYKSNNKQRHNYNFTVAAKAVSVKGRLNGCHNKYHIYSEKRHSFALTQLRCRGKIFKTCFFGWLRQNQKISKIYVFKRPGDFFFPFKIMY